MDMRRLFALIVYLAVTWHIFSPRKIKEWFVADAIMEKRTTDAGDNARWVLALIQFILILDTALLNVAVPSIGVSLSLDPAYQSWILNSYTIAFAGLLLLAGSLTDRVGILRILPIGLLVIIAGSALGAFAPSGMLVIASRALQGVGAALAGAAAMAAAFALYSGTERQKTLALFAAMAGLGGAVGTLSGGILTEWLGWRSTFWMISLAGAALVVAVSLVSSRLRVETQRRALNVISAASLTVALACVAFALTSASESSWLSPAVTASVMVSILAAGTFIASESRGANPLIDYRVWSSRGLLFSLSLAVAGQWVTVPTFLFVSIYMQRVLHASPLQAGLALLPMSFLVILVAPKTPAVIERFGLRVTLAASFFLMSIALLWLALTATGGNFWSSILGPTLVIAFVLPCINVSCNILIAQNAPADIPGVASGMLATAQQFGAAIGLAVWVSVSNFAYRQGISPDAEGLPAAYYIAAAAATAAAIYAYRQGRNQGLD
ncbi:MFS transporter [Ensifer sp. ENS05]|nr:MFS transporter [Ensifer sp. ENS05]